MKKRIFVNVFKYGLAFGLLGWVIYSNWAPAGGKGLGFVWQRHVIQGAPIHWDFLLGALAIFIASIVLTLVRWYYLVLAQGLPFRMADAMRLGMVGIYFNTFLPGAVGGDIVKAAALAREQSRRTVAVATVIMDRVIALWGLFWFVAGLGAIFWLTGLLEGPAAGPSKRTVIGAGLIVGVSLLVWLLMGLLPSQRAERFAGRLSRLPRVGGTAAEFWRAVWMYRCRQGSVAVALLISWVSFAGFVLAFYCCARALWDNDPLHPLPTLAQHFLIVPIGLLISAVPLFPGGAGIAELGFGYLYEWFGFDGANGVLGTLVQRVISWIVGLVGFGIYLRMRSGSPRPPAPRPGAASARAEGHRPREPEATSAS